MQNSEITTRWYTQFWAWVIIAMLATSVGLGVFLLIVANKNADALVADNYYDVGKGINTSLLREHLAKRLEIRASLILDEYHGTAEITLRGNSQPTHITLNLISPTQPERDRKVLLNRVVNTDGLYRGEMQDMVTGRRFVEIIGREGEKDWRLFDEFVLEDRRSIELQP